jgi:carboxyl-terminal processing protease
MSLMTPDRVRVGFAPNKRWAERDGHGESRVPKLGKDTHVEGRALAAGSAFSAGTHHQVPYCVGIGRLGV